MYALGNSRKDVTNLKVSQDMGDFGEWTEIDK